MSYACLALNALILIVLALAPTPGRSEPAAPGQASPSTLAANQAVQKALPMDDPRDMEEASRGFIAPLPDGGVIKNAQGAPVWDVAKYQFIEQNGQAPDTVNPSLWRQARLAMQGGLFKVTDGLYQVRNADVSNLTIFEGKTGIILADPLISAETARAALDLYYRHRPKKPVLAVLYSHSHVDHFGGARGVVDEKDVAAGKVKIIAPVGFLEAAVAENVLAGTAMSRRATYMYGNLLPASPTGQVGVGLGMTTSSGASSILPPTHTIEHTGQVMDIDGLTFEFMLAPDTEAPSEMHWYVRELKAVTAAENCCHTLHNVYTLRGAKIRDPLAWSKYLNETLVRWGDQSEVMYGMHNWPVWGRERVRHMLEMARDGYRFINDQTLRLANHGYTPDDIAENMAFPKQLANHFAMHGYYGTLNHNAKATYVKYLGWFDGNPAHLYPLAPVERAKRFVEYMNGADEVLKKARKSYEAGDYRFVAEVTNLVVFADPANQPARDLCADAMEQLGYQAESGPWRNFYLTGAKELRQGVAKLPAPQGADGDSVAAMSLDLLCDYLGMRLNAAKAGDRRIALNLLLTDTGQRLALVLSNGALSHGLDSQEAAPDATLRLNRATLNALSFGGVTFDAALASNAVQVEGEARAMGDLLAMLDTFAFWFPIVTPQAPGNP